MSQPVDTDQVPSLATLEPPRTQDRMARTQTDGHTGPAFPVLLANTASEFQASLKQTSSVPSRTHPGAWQPVMAASSLQWVFFWGPLCVQPRPGLKEGATPGMTPGPASCTEGGAPPGARAAGDTAAGDSPQPGPAGTEALDPGRRRGSGRVLARSGGGPAGRFSVGAPFPVLGVVLELCFLCLLAGRTSGDSVLLLRSSCLGPLLLSDAVSWRPVLGQGSAERGGRAGRRGPPRSAEQEVSCWGCTVSASGRLSVCSGSAFAGPDFGYCVFRFFVLLVGRVDS